jgi:hypothetical protein
MTWVKASGVALALLLVLSGLAHGFSGWPMLRGELLQAGVAPDSDLMGTAAAGWCFGSMAMLVFGCGLGLTAIGLGAGAVRVGPVVALGIGYLAFGDVSCVVIHISTHFVAFAVIGLLILIWARSARTASGRGLTPGT